MGTKLLTTFVLASLLAGGITAAASAASSDENREANALQGTKVTLSQAIATAEQQTGGQAYDAGVDIKNGNTRIAVETNGPKGVQTVLVDPQNGQILGSHAGAEQD